MGYVVVAADYLGLGESQIVPPYLLNANSATTVIDLLRAAKTYLDGEGIVTDGSLYLTGYSQGGIVTMATHHEIEKNYSSEFQVTASAPLAGAYDLSLTVDSILSWETYIEPVLIAQLLYTYDHYYNWDRLDEIFRAPYASAIPGYFDGTMTLDVINLKLTETLADLLSDQFLSDYKEGSETDLDQALADNSLLNYTPTAPVRFFHGTADQTVPPQNTLAAKAWYEANGKTNVEYIPVPGLNHEDGAAPAIIGAMQWFEELRVK
jgi:dienelactone hydrolase